jgi:hypothetical protein
MHETLTQSSPYGLFSFVNKSLYPSLIWPSSCPCLSQAPVCNVVNARHFINEFELRYRKKPKPTKGDIRKPHLQADKNTAELDEVE